MNPVHLQQFLPNLHNRNSVNQLFQAQLASSRTTPLLLLLIGAVADLGEGPGPQLILTEKKNKTMKKRRRKKSRQGKRYSQINFVSTLQLNFFSACSKKIRIRHFVLFLAHYATLASDSFTVAMLAGKKAGKLGSSTFHRFLTAILFYKVSFFVLFYTIW